MEVKVDKNENQQKNKNKNQKKRKNQKKKTDRKWNKIESINKIQNKIRYKFWRWLTYAVVIDFESKLILHLGTLRRTTTIHQAQKLEEKIKKIKNEKREE